MKLIYLLSCIIFFWGCEKCSHKNSFTPNKWLKGKWTYGNNNEKTFLIQDDQFEEITPWSSYNHIENGFKLCKKGDQIIITSEGWVRQFERLDKDQLIYWIYPSDPADYSSSEIDTLKRQ